MSNKLPWSVSQENDMQAALESYWIDKENGKIPRGPVVPPLRREPWGLLEPIDPTVIFKRNGMKVIDIY